MNDLLPSFAEDLFRPFNDWFGNGGMFSKPLNVPAVNITESKDDYQVSMAAPGMKKNDFNIGIEGNLLSISCEKEEKKQENEAHYTRREFSYTSFSRSFTLPDEVSAEKIDATYEDGVLKLVLPKKEEAKKALLSKHIHVK